jgi:hypothetical protein
VRLSFPAVSGQPSSESECNLVDSLLYDIRSGFQQSKAFDSNSRDLRVSTGCNQFPVQLAALKPLARHVPAICLLCAPSKFKPFVTFVTSG